MKRVLIKKLNILLQEAKKECRSNEVVEIELAIEAYNALNLDSQRWQAFIRSPFRFFGYAGLDHGTPTLPCKKTGKDGYAHFGCEMWTKHTGYNSNAGREILIGFADQAIKAQK